MKRVLLAIAMAVTALASHADPKSEALLRVLREKYPQTTFTAVRPTPMTGIFEVQMGRNLAYTDDLARQFLFGSMFDMEAREDLTAARRAALGIEQKPAQAQQPQQQQRVDAPIQWSDLPLADAIVKIKGDGSRKLAVFSDPACGFCKRLEPELAKLDNVTIYTFVVPLIDRSPEGFARSTSVWCAGDKGRLAAWEALMLQGKSPKPATCPAPLSRNQELASKLGVNGTPTMFAADGRRLRGAAGAEQINSFLDAAK